MVEGMRGASRGLGLDGDDPTGAGAGDDGGDELAPGDFLAAAVLLGVTGLAIEGLVRRVQPGMARVAAVAEVVVGLLLVWAELAVGIVG